jgi:uncharacterized protein
MLAPVDHAETDSGPRGNAAGTARLCVVTREVRPVEELIRFVVAPDGTVTPDIKRKLPGRGVWVTGTRDMLVRAVKQGAFPKAFRAQVKVSPDLVAMVDALLERATLDALAIARKGSQLVTGFHNVEEAAERGTAVAILHAADAAPDGLRKILAAVRRGTDGDAAKVAVVGTFNSTQLDLALARPNVVHAALLTGRAGETFLARWSALEQFRMTKPDGRGREQPNQHAPRLGSE